MRVSVWLLIILPASASAGVYYSGDRLHPLPAAWRGYLPDHRILRQCSNDAAAGRNYLRDRYADSALRLEALGKERALKADEIADLAALYLRLGTPLKAIELLRPAQRRHPEHFAIAANLGTAWQLVGDLDQAGRRPRGGGPFGTGRVEGIRAVSPQVGPRRGRDGKNADGLDDLFGVRFVGESGRSEANQLAKAEAAKLPRHALAIAQQLALWLPQDARLMWLLAELANARGDVRTAANILDGCITELGFKSEDARHRRTLYRNAVDELEKKGHDTRQPSSEFHSPRVFARIIDESQLPPVQVNGLNRLPWPALAETSISRKFELTLLKYVEQLDGKSVQLTGYMVPGNQDELSEFLFIETRSGAGFVKAPAQRKLCWSCCLMGSESSRVAACCRCKERSASTGTMPRRPSSGSRPPQ